MPRTTSPTLIQDLLIPIDQTSSSSQNSKKVENQDFDYTVQSRYSDLINLLWRFRENTNDGGVLLKKNLPKPDWACRLYGNRVIVIFQQTPLSEGLLTKTSDNWFVWKQTPKLPPHLDAIHWIKEATALSQERIGQLVDVTRQTIINWEHGFPISDTHQQRLFAVREILSRAARQHQNQTKLKAWLDTPNGADGRTPAQLLKSNEINRARLLAMASQSPHITHTPEWVNHPIPKAFHTRAEHHQEAWPPDADNELAAYIKNEDESRNEDREEHSHS